MQFGMEQIDIIVEKIDKGELPYKNTIIVGDNSSGKSYLMKRLLEKNGCDNKIYFIDAVNRGFDVSKISNTDKKPEYKLKILETRMDDRYFNLVDSFNYLGTLTERVEMIYNSYKDEVQELFCELTGDRFEITENSFFGEVDFGNRKGLLSSGYQAIIRILLELLYYQEMSVMKYNIKEAWVLIDELDEFLSPKYCSKIIEFLKEKFLWAKWVLTTHSSDLVVSAKDANLILIKDGNCEVHDINDYETVSEIQLLFHRLFDLKYDSTSDKQRDMDVLLRSLLNNRINNAWKKTDEVKLNQINDCMLSASQKLILKQIKEW